MSQPTSTLSFHEIKKAIDEVEARMKSIPPEMVYVVKTKDGHIFRLEDVIPGFPDVSEAVIKRKAEHFKNEGIEILMFEKPKPRIIDYMDMLWKD